MASQGTNGGTVKALHVKEEDAVDVGQLAVVIE